MTIKTKITRVGEPKRIIKLVNTPISSARRSKFLQVNFSNLAIYAGIFVLVLVVLIANFQKPDNPEEIINRHISQLPTEKVVSVDDVVAVDVASKLALAAKLPVATSVANLAVSTKIANEFAQFNSTKQLTVGSTVDGRAVIGYVVETGDTIDTIASKFNLTKDTIIWANNLVSNRLYAGQTLQILPTNGVIYTVKVGDTIDSLADKYRVDRDRLVLYNDLVNDSLVVGQQLVMPDATMPENERPGYIDYIRYQYYYGYQGGDITVLGGGSWDFNETVRSYIPHVSSLYSNTSGNRMYTGQCTWWAWERRYAMGKPIPAGFLGNGGEWGYRMQSMGGVVNNQPAVGAVAESAGHVAVVESINDDGSIVISEMNNNGTYRVVLRTIPASSVGNYRYIH